MKTLLSRYILRYSPIQPSPLRNAITTEVMSSSKSAQDPSWSPVYLSIAPLTKSSPGLSGLSIVQLPSLDLNLYLKSPSLSAHGIVAVLSSLIGLSEATGVVRTGVLAVDFCVVDFLVVVYSVVGSCSSTDSSSGSADVSGFSSSVVWYSK